MKRFTYYLILIFAATCLLNSCSIKEELKDTPTPSMIKNEDDVTAVVKGMYSQFNDASAFKFQGMLMFMLGADDIYATTSGELQPYTDRTYNSVNTGSFWNRLFSTVGNANDFLSLIAPLKLDSAYKARVTGEAYFLRAFSYYYLVRMYGGVPIRTEAVNVNSNFYLPRNSMDEVYAQIFTDLKQASALLPLYSKIPLSELGRATKGAAQAILAQAYLTYGNQLSLRGQDATEQYTNAELYADSVINSNQYHLLNNYADLFDITKESGAYDEVIFGVRFQTDNQARAQPAAGSEFALRFGAPNTNLVCGNPPNGGGDGSMKCMHWVADYYRTGDYGTTTTPIVIDYRTEKGMMQKGYNVNQNKYYAIYPNIPATGEGTITYPCIGKYIDPAGKDARNNGNDLFIIRLAEVYLIKAEAENELNGPTATALGAFNTVRARARKANGTSRTIPANLVTGLTQDQFRMKIFDERELELLGEGQRWFDLVRMRSPLSSTQTMYEYQFKTVFPTRPQTQPTYNSSTKKYSNSMSVYANTENVTIPKFLLFPIPSAELLQNPNFGPQNPGW